MTRIIKSAPVNQNEKVIDPDESITLDRSIVVDKFVSPDKAAPVVGAVNDPVYHPSHYTSGKYEVIDIIEDQLGIDGLRGFCLGNAIKYICRAGKKDKAKTIEDLEKAAWYVERYVNQAKKRGS